MSYKLFLDDIRSPSAVYPDCFEDEFTVARSYDQFVNVILDKGVPEFISFDNDLGCNENGEVLKEGYDAAKWLVNESGLDISDLEFNVHSSNPVAKENIEALLINYISFLHNTKI